MELEEVGRGLNIPGGVVGGDYRWKEVDSVMSAPFSVCYKGLPSEGKGGCNYGKKSKEKNDLSFISPVHFFFCKDQIASIWLCE